MGLLLLVNDPIGMQDREHGDTHTHTHAHAHTAHQSHTTQYREGQKIRKTKICILRTEEREWQSSESIRRQMGFVFFGNGEVLPI